MSFSRPPERTPASSLPPAPSDANWDGGHPHRCTEGHHWQHTAPCAAPLRVALSECSGCRTPGGQQRAQPSGATASSRARALQVVRDLVAALPVPVFLLAGGILLILLLTFSWTPSSTGPRESARVAERRLDTRPLASVSSRA